MAPRIPPLATDANGAKSKPQRESGQLAAPHTTCVNALKPTAHVTRSVAPRGASASRALPERFLQGYKTVVRRTRRTGVSGFRARAPVPDNIAQSSSGSRQRLPGQWGPLYCRNLDPSQRPQCLKFALSDVLPGLLTLR